VTQYVLIAVHKQRFPDGAFVIGVLVAAISNWALVPRYGAVAAAALLIPAELALFFPLLRGQCSATWPRCRGLHCWAAALGNGCESGYSMGLERLGVPLLVALTRASSHTVRYCFVLRPSMGGVCRPAQLRQSPTSPARARSHHLIGNRPYGTRGHYELRNPSLNWSTSPKHYGETAALSDFSLSVLRGEIHGVLGDNGRWQDHIA